MGYRSLILTASMGLVDTVDSLIKVLLVGRRHLACLRLLLVPLVLALAGQVREVRTPLLLVVVLEALVLNGPLEMLLLATMLITGVVSIFLHLPSIS
jgi:hypothetical protein